MAKAATVKKKVEVEKTPVLSDVRLYARKIWLAGLGAYAKAGQEGVDYLRELVKAGEGVEKRGRKSVDAGVEAANSQLDSVKGSVLESVAGVKEKVEVQIDRIEKAFDNRVAVALNRLGIPSRQDVEALSAKLDELSALLEHVARTK